MSLQTVRWDGLNIQFVHEGFACLFAEGAMDDGRSDAIEDVHVDEVEVVVVVAHGSGGLGT